MKRYFIKENDKLREVDKHYIENLEPFTELIGGVQYNKKSHIYQVNDLVDYCIVCGGVENSLTTECCGVKLSNEAEKEIEEGNLDFRYGRWFNLTSAHIVNIEETCSNFEHMILTVKREVPLDIKLLKRIYWDYNEFRINNSLEYLFNKESYSEVDNVSVCSCCGELSDWKKNALSGLDMSCITIKLVDETFILCDKCCIKDDSENNCENLKLFVDNAYNNKLKDLLVEDNYKSVKELHWIYNEIILSYGWDPLFSKIKVTCPEDLHICITCGRLVEYLEVEFGSADEYCKKDKLYICRDCQCRKENRPNTSTVTTVHDNVERSFTLKKLFENRPYYSEREVKIPTFEDTIEAENLDKDNQNDTTYVGELSDKDAYSYLTQSLFIEDRKLHKDPVVLEDSVIITERGVSFPAFTNDGEKSEIIISPVAIDNRIDVRNGYTLLGALSEVYDRVIEKSENGFISKARFTNNLTVEAEYSGGEVLMTVTLNGVDLTFLYIDEKTKHLLVTMENLYNSSSKLYSELFEGETVTIVSDVHIHDKALSEEELVVTYVKINSSTGEYLPFVNKKHLLKLLSTAVNVFNDIGEDNGMDGDVELAEQFFNDSNKMQEILKSLKEAVTTDFINVESLYDYLKKEIKDFDLTWFIYSINIVIEREQRRVKEEERLIQENHKWISNYKDMYNRLSDNSYIGDKNSNNKEL